MDHWDKCDVFSAVWFQGSGHDWEMCMTSLLLHQFADVVHLHKPILLALQANTQQYWPAYVKVYINNQS